jgi:hypothetical protein
MNTIRRLPSRKMSANESDKVPQSNNDIKGVMDYAEGNVFNEIWITNSNRKASVPARKIQTSAEVHRGVKVKYLNSQ